MVLLGEKTILASSFDLVGTASDGLKLVEAAVSLKPDLVILDISLPTLNGIAAARHIKQQAPDVKLIFLTMHAELSYVKAAFDAGAAGYVLKTDPACNLILAIEKILLGELYVSPDIPGAAQHLQQLTSPTRLTHREREVLQLVAEGKPSKEIAHLLSMTVRTVSFHRENIKRKLGVSSTAEMTRHAISLGF
jgi:DNA-binding NarL/FixJ family response regulator